MEEDVYASYERCLVATIFEYASKRFKTQIQFARELWPGKSDFNVNTKLRALREKNSRGKPQALRVSELAKMADVLGVPLSSLALEVETKLRLGWSEDSGGQLETIVAEKNVPPSTVTGHHAPPQNQTLAQGRGMDIGTGAGQ